MTAPNPYEVLRLDPTASEEEIVRHAGRLRQRVTDEETLTAIRQAVQALTARPEDRRRLALLTHPRPEYAHPALDRLAGAFRRPPAATESAGPFPELDEQEFRTLLMGQALEELDLPPMVFEPVASAEDAAEIQRQLAEALWQSLLADLRA